MIQMCGMTHAYVYEWVISHIRTNIRKYVFVSMCDMTHSCVYVYAWVISHILTNIRKYVFVRTCEMAHSYLYVYEWVISHIRTNIHKYSKQFMCTCDMIHITRTHELLYLHILREVLSHITQCISFLSHNVYPSYILPRIFVHPRISTNIYSFLYCTHSRECVWYPPWGYRTFSKMIGLFCRISFLL